MTASAGPVLHDLYSEFGDRVSFLTLYVREAHPGDRYVQPQDFDTKLAQAREYAQRDNISWPVAVDDIDGTLHRTLDAKPNACYVVDADGTVAFRALWTNHSPPLREALAAVAEGRRGALGESEAKAVPMLSGTGSMWQVLSKAGPVALRDVARQAPPMWLSARLADILRPLPPVGRGAAAMATMAAATAVGALGARRLARPDGTASLATRPRSPAGRTRVSGLVRPSAARRTPRGGAPIRSVRAPGRTASR